MPAVTAPLKETGGFKAGPGHLLPSYLDSNWYT